MDADKVEVWNKVDEFLLRCGSIRDPYEFCVAVLDGLKELIQFDEGVILMLDGNRRIVRKHFMGVPKKLSSLYLEYYTGYSLGDLSLNSDVSEQLNKSYIRVIEWSDFEDSHDEFIENYIRPRRLKRTLAMLFFDLDGSPSVSFSLDRLSDLPFDRSDIGILNRVARHLNNLYKNLIVHPSDETRAWDSLPGADTLTAREAEVVELLCQGITPANISRKLHISQGTTNKHIVHIYKKLGVGSRQELLVRVLGQ